ncbi:MAG: hypothetical protein GDA68_10240 [Nitrospira sp. CR2.1]|nr:hypothetical protein [Nitrospira sp. CR2.1]
MFSNLASLSVLPGSFRLPFLPLKRHPDDRLLPAAYEFAWDTQHSLYDCFYLAFAEAVDGRLITADRKFYKALAGSVLHERLVWVEDLGSETSSRILQSQGREASLWLVNRPACVDKGMEIGLSEAGCGQRYKCRSSRSGFRHCCRESVCDFAIATRRLFQIPARTAVRGAQSLRQRRTRGKPRWP